MPGCLCAIPDATVHKDLGRVRYRQQTAFCRRYGKGPVEAHRGHHPASRSPLMSTWVEADRRAKIRRTESCDDSRVELDTRQACLNPATKRETTAYSNSPPSRRS